MSDIVVKIYVGDELLGYAEFQGSAGIVHPAVFKTHEELVAVWRSPETWRVCSCEPPNAVEAVARHEDDEEIWWSGFACRTCLVFRHWNEAPE